MHYMSISFTHKNTDICVREKLSFSDNENKRKFLQNICSSKYISEAMVLSTCNRVEIFTRSLEHKEAEDLILSQLHQSSGIDLEELTTRADIYEDEGAIHHLFSVASSLDSLVIGETQIVGQLKDAFIFAYENGFAKLNISRAMHYAFKCAASIRNSTDISKNHISVSSVAVAKAKEIFGSIENIEALIVGAGEMSRLAGKHLVASGAKVTIINRSLENAKDLADELGINASYDSISKLAQYINKNKIIFSATGSSNPVITDDMLENKDFDRYFFDIAVPRDIDITPTDKIHIFAVDDLDEIVKKNTTIREEQAQIAYALVGDMTNEFFKWIQSLASTPIIKALRFKAREVAENEIQKAIKKGYLKNSDKEEARKLVHQVFKAFLHTPSVNLKDLGNKVEADAIIRSVQYIFDIQDKFKEFNFYKCEYEWEKDSEI
ncbi:glutamyl-tRNA reductase [Campylobacter sp. RM12327]|uniref:glutamyl-tRNA reductase n=1 Tax=Campylobacter sputorum TaxID=206 RepID=UPI000B783DD6|nr:MULTISPECIES: glutamyl-tRNA reductase [Campylobacter]ASM39969.1 glutamyl-tRNA reductase [Campylobacter sputorum]MBE7357620.1 glutamyl-tRNA reductase [Campylobacter sp. RM11302]MBF6669266.1 glutamyl-tRNA reductase [Campylobacter sp. RM12327]MBF6674535.1 glutamyl-tRNA reductase [Campylobacter sp. RM13538]MBF6675488.1 glutamyl-tRNA reductase [Campylobacter sp. RM12321]